jgi:hypothetical protein
MNEMLVETNNGGWVVGKKSDQREFYILFDQKSANLLQINGMVVDLLIFTSSDEMKKLSSTYFKDIFID